MRYEPASSSPRETGCQTGTRALHRAIKTVWPELGGPANVYGCWNRRHIAGSKKWSLHAEGRAIDVGVPGDRDEEGWALSCELVAHRKIYGTMRVIWAGHIWSTEIPNAWRELGADTTDRHLDHIHLEQFWGTALKPASVEQTFALALQAARRPANA